MTDAVLFNKWRSERDAEAFRELASRYSAMVYATCLRVLRNPQEAEEAAQECFEKLAGAPRIASPYLGPWLHKVATNRALDRLRAEGRRRVREDRYALERGLAQTPEWDDIYPLVDEAIAELPEDLRVPLVSHFLENRTHEAIAQELGIPRPTVTYRLQRALERVRQSLKNRGVEVMSATLAALMGEKMAEAATVPAALEAALGRLAVAGLKSTTVLGGAGASTLLMSTAAKVLMGVAVTAISLGFAWNLLVPRQSSAPPPTRSVEAVQPANAQHPVPATQSAVKTSTPTPSATVSGAVSSQSASEGGVIAGRVYDAKTGQGLAGMSIYAEYKGADVNGTAKSDSDGAYRITGLVAGAYSVQANGHVAGYSRRGLRIIEATVDPRKPVEGVDFALSPSIPVSGRVVSAEGKPVSGAQVGGLLSEDPDARHAESKADGSFTLDMPDAGTGLQVQAKYEGFQSLIVRRDLLGQEGLGGVDLVLTEPLTASIEGKLLDANGRPAAGYSLHPKSGMMGNLVGIPEAVTGADGSFRADKLASGTYEFLFSRPGQNTWNDTESVGTVSVATGQTLKNAVLRIQVPQDGLSISGRVVDKSGKGLPGVDVDTDGPNGRLLLTYTDEQGAFAFYGLQEGRHWVQANPRDREHSFTLVSNVDAGTQGLTIVLDGVGRIQGRAVDARDGKPLPRFETYLCNGANPDFRPDLLINRQDVNDPDGKFIREQVGTGPQTLVVKAPGFAPALQVVEVTANQTVSSTDFRLEPAARLAGLVVDEHGKPMVDVGIYTDSHNPWIPNGEEALARSAADGTFSMDLLSPGITHVIAYLASYPPVRAETDRMDGIVLRKGGTVEGRVTVDGKPTEGWRISVGSDSRGFTAAVTKPDGTYRIDGVAAGKTTVDARFVGGRNSSQEVTIEVDSASTVDFDFGAADATVEGTVTDAGKPVAGGVLTLVVEPDTGAETFNSQVDETGHYVFSNVPSGRARLTFTSFGVGQMSVVRRFDIEVVAGSTVRHDIEMDAPGTVSGTAAGATGAWTGIALLLPADTPLPAKMDNDAFRELSQLYAVGTALCGSDGSFELKKVPPGDWVVMAVCVQRDSPQSFANAKMDAATVHVEKDAATVNLVPR